MTTFQQMIDILNKIKNNNYYSTSYLKSYDKLIQMGYISLSPENMLVNITKKFVKKYENRLLNFGFTKYEIQAFEYSPLKAVYFKNQMLAQYINNPNYHFRWNHYRGSVIYVNSGVDDVYLKNICLAHDLNKKEPVIFTFLGDILKLDIAHQNYIKRFEIIDQRHLEPNKEVIKNLILGQRSSYEDTDIYNLLIIGMKICNQIFRKKGGMDFFIEVKDSHEYEHFHPIFISSRINYYLFILELYKMIYDNMSHKVLKKIIIENDPSVKQEIKNQSKWSLWRIMELSLGKENFEYLKKLSEIRNIPAHEIYNNDLNSRYWKKQDEMLIETYRFINSIIIKHSGGTLLTEFTNYNSVFGPNGRISTGNGFNQSPYKFYNGQIRLVCERFQIRDAEYLIAFKSLDDFSKKFSTYIKKKRPDLEKKSISYLVKKLLTTEYHKPDLKMVESFFKGRFYIERFYNPDKFEINQHIDLGKKYAEKFLKRYKLENIFVFADSTDPYFHNFNQCISENDLEGKGYITELLHYFKNEYEYDNVITDPSKNLAIQVLSNIWD